MRLCSLIILFVFYFIIVFSILFMIYSLSGCSVLSQTHGRANFHHVIDQDNDTLGQNPHCEIEIIKPLNPYLDARLLHQSWCFTGWPFNDHKESTVNAVGVGVKLW